MSDAQARMVKKVQSLLRQAADPSVTDEESQAFTAKAAELMTAHSISEAQARFDDGDHRPEEIGWLEFTIIGTGGHGKARAQALGDVAEGYGCQVVYLGNTYGNHDRKMLVCGTESARAALELLLASVSLQIENAARRATTAEMRDLRVVNVYTEASLTRYRRTYFRSFVMGYGYAVKGRLQAMRGKLAATAAEQGTSAGAELVLVRDADRVAAELARRYPNIKPGRAHKVSISHAIREGYEAGQNADLGHGGIEKTRARSLEA